VVGLFAYFLGSQRGCNAMLLPEIAFHPEPF